MDFDFPADYNDQNGDDQSDDLWKYSIFDGCFIEIEISGKKIWSLDDILSLMYF